MIRQAATALLLALAGTTAQAQAPTYGIGISTISRHYGNEDFYPCNYRRGPKYENYREVNPGISGRMIFSPSLEVEAGVYANSVHQTSFFTSTTWTPLTAGPVRAGLIIGAASGYCWSVTPFVGLAANYWVADRVALQALITPPLRIDNNAVAGAVGLRVLYNFE
jgi:hypothetical protein